MKIQVQRDRFLKGCQLAARVFPERVVDPSFRSLLLQAQEDTCTVYAVGADAALRLEVPAVIGEAGEAMIPARHALAVAREAIAEELTLESGQGLVRAQGHDAEFVLEVPGPVRAGATAVPTVGMVSLIPSDLFCQAVRRTLFTVGRATARYRLDTVLWEVEPDQVRLVASDNKRLAAAEIFAQGANEQQSPVQRLLPARAVDLLARLAEGQPEPIQATFGDKHILFRVGSAALLMRSIVGTFPDWRKAVNAQPRHLFPLPVGPFLAAVRQAAVLREKEAARLELRFEPGWVQLRSRQAGAGWSRVKLPLPLSASRAEIALNPLLLMEVLRAFEPESNLLLGLTDQDTPALLSDGDGYVYALGPLRRQ